MNPQIQQAIAERRSTFLSQPEWQSLPWKGHQKHISQQLLDLMAQAAGIIETAYQTIGNPELQTRPDILIVAILGLIDQGRKLDIMLRAFYRRLEKTTAGPLFQPRLSSSPYDVEKESEIEKVFPVAFQFPSMTVAHTCMVYWATCCILWSGLRVLYSLLAVFKAQMEGLSSPSEMPPGVPDLDKLPPLDHGVDPTILAKNICQSMEFCMQAGPMTPAGAVFPLKVAIETLSLDPTLRYEVAWAEDAMERIRSGTGVRILGHLGCKFTDRSFIPG